MMLFSDLIDFQHQLIISEARKLPEEVDPAIKTEFENALQRSKKLPKQPVDIQLDLYGLFKQAIIGDVEGERPGRVNIRARAKYDAWTSRKGMSKETAMKEYIALIAKLEQKYK